MTNQDRHNLVTRRINLLSAFIATCALVVSGLLVWSIRENGQRQLRAYASPSGAVILDFDTREDEKPFSARIVFRNSGQTPAYEFAAQGGMSMGPYPLKEKLETTGDFVGPTVIGPGMDYNLNIASLALNKEQWAAVAGQGHAIFVHGNYRYFDAFKTKREGAFLLYWGGKGGLRVDRALAFYISGNRSN